jgi:OOP family OmpA-OmpF porin
MQAKSIPLVIAFAAAAAGISAPAAAKGPEAGDIYAGVTLGGVAIVPKGLNVDSDKRAEGRLSGGLFVGAQIGALPIGSGWPLAVEASHQNIARHKVTYKTANGARSELTASGSSTSLALKLDAPITERFALYGKLGVARNKVDGSTPAGQPVIDIDGSKNGLLTALGLQYRFDAPVTLRGELTNFGKSSAKSSAGGLSVSLAYRF